jgi:hypothetical protein
MSVDVFGDPDPAGGIELATANRIAMFCNPRIAAAACAVLLSLIGIGACSGDRGAPASVASSLDGADISIDLEAPGAAPSFEDHPLYPFERIARPAVVDLGSHPEAPRLRTVLNDGAAAGPNFAGELTVVTWPCGAMCQQMMLIDARDGRVITKLEAPLGFDFRIDSRLLIENPAEAVRENRCPSCTTSYHLWSGGELLRIPEQAWLGNTPVPPHYRDLVSAVRAREALAAATEDQPEVIRTAWNRLVLLARDGSRHLFEDRIEGGDIHWLHDFVGTVERLNSHIVRRIYVPEGEQILMISADDGSQVMIDASPVPSPDGRRFVTASLDLVAGHTPNRIRIYRVEADGPVLEWEATPREWGAANPTWVDDRTVVLDRSLLKWDDHSLITSSMTVVREERGWVIASSPDHARDSLLGFFSALGSGSYAEAAQLFGGSYEILEGWNPEIPASERAALWEAACTRNGLQCMKRVEVLQVEEVSTEETRLTVRFRTDGGNEFVLGPCCGATVEEMPPVRDFEFTVRRSGDRYLVETLPVYVP